MRGTTSSEDPKWGRIKLSSRIRLYYFSSVSLQSVSETSCFLQIEENEGGDACMPRGENLAELHRTRKKLWHKNLTATGRHSLVSSAAGRSASVKSYMSIATEQCLVLCIKCWYRGLWVCMAWQSVLGFVHPNKVTWHPHVVQIRCGRNSNGWREASSTNFQQGNFH